MRFRTEIKIPDYPFVLDPCRPMALIGSCFAQNIARKMTESGWSNFNNTGTLYNPLSIARVIEILLFNDNWKEEICRSCFSKEQMIHSWLFDSHFSQPTIEDLLESVSSARNSLCEVLKKGEALIVTFGTSWCYFLTEDEDYVVANCHKVDQKMFTRRRISVNEITEVWNCLVCKLLQHFPQLHIIFTVSPVRHLKDGFEGNSRSKAVLQLAVEDICVRNDRCHYFPAFEIINDDLRDYRFYASDLVHLSESAIEYIWEVFRMSFVDSQGETRIKEGNRQFKARNHRPIILDRN